MNGSGIIRRQQIKNMLYSLIAFSIIFIAFGAVVFNQVRSSLFSKLDDELTTSRRIMEELVTGAEWSPAPGPGPGDAPSLFGSIRSPRVIPLLRDLSGSVVNFGSVSSTYFEQYLKSIPFDETSLNTIVFIKIRNLYFFRSLTVPVKTQSGEELYLQLLINADSERSLLLHISFIIAVSIGVFTVLSFLASFILSQKTMRPVKTAWNRQTEFVENVSHELRTPLTVIQNSIEALLAAPQEKIIDRSETLGLLLNETERLSKLVTDMLTLARSDGTMTELQKDLFSPDLLIRAVCEPYAELAESQDKNFRLELDCPANIRADKSRIHQLLVILLDNALKYTDPKDDITVGSRLLDGRVCLTVSDTGIGISDAAMDRVFDRFFRESGARARDRSGSGLGLSIARWIVERHGGTIKAGHNEPKGTIITVMLPKS